MLSQQITQRVRCHPLFRNLGDESFAKLLQCARVVFYQRDELVFRAGEPCEGFFLVVQGLVKLFRVANDGREATIHLISENELFAEGALFAGQDYPVNARCMQSTSLVLFQRVPFLELLATDQHLVLAMFAGMSQWLRRMVDQLENVAFAQAPQRLAQFLIDLPCHRVDQQLYIELPAKKQLIAGQLGMTPPTFSRCLAKMETQGLITVKGRRLILHDTQQLQELAQGDDLSETTQA